MAEDATTLGPEALHRMLLLVPAHILLFDADRICRYAAPFGPSFLSQRVDDLLGAPATVVLADMAFVLASLEQVLARGEPIAHPAVPAPAHARGLWNAERWHLYLQPWRTDRRGAHATPAIAPAAATAGVLLSCHPASPREPAVDSIGLPFWATESERSARLLERIRTQLTVIQGNTQAFQRRAARAAQAPALELDRVVAAVREADRLLAEYEQATRLSTRHPDSP